MSKLLTSKRRTLSPRLGVHSVENFRCFLASTLISLILAVDNGVVMLLIETSGASMRIKVPAGNDWFARQPWPLSSIRTVSKTGSLGQMVGWTLFNAMSNSSLSRAVSGCLGILRLQRVFLK